MKTIFKIWNVVMIVLSVIMVVLGLLGGGLLGGLIALLSCIITLIMAIYGFKEEYIRCRNFAIVVIVFDVFDLITDRSAGSVFSLLLAIIYLVFCIHLSSKSY